MRWRLLAGVIGVTAVAGCRESVPAPVPPEVSTPSVLPPSSPRDDASLRETVPSRESASLTAGPGSEGRSPDSARASRVFRPDDDRPAHDDAALAALGIRRYESRRLVLYTDLPAEQARAIGPIVDQLCVALEDYFGPLPPARDGSDFQMTGYVCRTVNVMEEGGLLPGDLPLFNHGRHRGREFWMFVQNDFDYTRHLVLHEATHCFMTLLSGPVGPPWYIEGMAELFGTHRVASDGTATFRVTPETPDEMRGFGRLELIFDEVSAGRGKTLEQVFDQRPDDFLPATGYAWAWAACSFFDGQPRYRERFRKLGSLSARSRIGSAFAEEFGPDAAEINDGWAVSTHGLGYGYDRGRAAIAFRPGRPLTDGETATISVAADRGWQSAAVRVESGRTYTLTATGEVTLSQTGQPWVSTPAGIGFDYADGRPMGALLLAVRREPGAPAPDPASGLLSPEPLSGAITWTAPATGTLYFRINDAWNRLSDNTGAYAVTISSGPGP